ncbi:MAG: UDP-N-acetylmuramoyl-tripeptide--D-alanyl-D-alanine ligase [Syntrophobacteraceae bacterium]|nr:UDP-N-acetylmuramoyl-tripeptide--D-alanyl-D-alanine ligase [Desulfobacteraceae bacterium]
MHWTVAKLIEATGGRLIRGNPDRPVGGISTDTRAIRAGDCFVALRGERHDAHDYISGALEGGAGAIVFNASRPDAAASLPEGVAAVEVADTLFALGELARYHRRRHFIPVVGITGSNGKTSTKEMVAGILSVRRNVLKNKGNFNNLIGVPLTLLGLEPQHEAAVVEMGINVPGEMERLVEIAGPTAGLITNIHPAHLEGLGSLDGILAEKGKLWAGLGEDGLAAVNLDDERLAAFAEGVAARTVRYSLKNPGADVRLAGKVDTVEGASVFQMILGDEVVSVRLPVMGIHQVQNALAASALAWGMGEDPATIVEGLAGCAAVKQRMQTHRLKGDRVLVDDTYNANPGSVIAAVRTVLSAGGGKPCIAVLGEMRELGPDSASIHRELGREIVKLGVSRLIAVGELGREIVEGAREAGLPFDAGCHVPTHEAAVERLRESWIEGAWVLVKGSRAMAMERIVEGILAK